RVDWHYALPAHARIDLPGGGVRDAILRSRAAIRGMAQSEQDPCACAQAGGVTPRRTSPSLQELWILLTARSHNLDAGIRILFAGLQQRKSHDPLHVPCDVGIRARPDDADRGCVRGSGPRE